LYGMEAKVLSVVEMEAQPQGDRAHNTDG